MSQEGEASVIVTAAKREERRAATAIVAARLSAEMYRRRMTCRHLAVLAGLDDRTVRNVLDGKDTRLTTLEALAIALNVPLVALVSEPAA